jgi:hypothetical protein
MADNDLDIDLRLRRRRFIEQAGAQRPRLRGNLKQLGAVGPVLRPLAAQSRKAFVKVVMTKGTTTQQHLSYLTRAHNPLGQAPTLFGPAAAALPRFMQAAQQDPHQFRIVVQVPEHPHLERTRYIALFMAQVERDLGRPLDWTAAHHYDTPYPHTHIVLRGQDRNGKDLYMARDYLTYGLRSRASQLLTGILGPVRQQQVMQSDRHVYDGVPRSLEDPDVRARKQTHITTQQRPALRSTQAAAPAPHAEPAAGLAAQLEGLRQTLHQQHQAQHGPQRGQQRGGWGHGR